MADQISSRRLRELRDRAIRYIDENGMGKPKGEVPVIDLRSHLGVTDAEYKSLYLLLHEHRLARTDGMDSHISLTEIGRGEVFKLPAEMKPASPDVPDAQWDVFVCHASEDKDAFVRPLVHALRERGLSVWFDEYTLTVGDSLRRSIDRGLARSRFGIVVISPHFLNKNWPQRELDGLVAREIDGVKVILPVWHNIDLATVRSYSPPLADRLATSSDKGLDRVIDELIRAVRRDNPVGSFDRRQPEHSQLAKFIETPSTTNIAFFWAPSEVLATASSGADAIEYRFDEPRAFYLRLIPTAPVAEPLRLTTLTDLTQRQRPDVLTRTMHGSIPGRNRFGAISYEPHGNSTNPVGFTQLFRNGEIWGVSGQFAAHYKDILIVPMKNVTNIYDRVLANFISIVSDDLKIAPPYQVEIGATGLKDMRVSLPRPSNSWDDVSEPIYENDLRVRRVLNDGDATTRTVILNEFIVKLYDLAGVPM